MVESVLGDIGEFIGSVLRFVIELIRSITFGLGDLIDSFFDGIARGIGLRDSSAFHIAIVALGLVLFWLALRAFLRRRFVPGVVWLLLGLIVIGWVVS